MMIRLYVDSFRGFFPGSVNLLPVFFFLCFFLFGQPGLTTLQAASLVDVYQLAQKNDPSSQSVYFQTMATKEGRRQAVARLLPTFSASAGYNYTYQNIISSDNTVYGSGETDFGTTTYGLNLTQPIFHWDLFVGLRQSKAESLRAEAENVLSRQELVVRVATLYLQALAAQDQVDFSKAEQAAVEKHLELAQGRFEMGLVPITDLHDAKARMATTRAKTIEAENLLDDALQALREVAGQPVASLEPLREAIDLVSPEPVDVDTWIRGALQQNPAIELQKQAVEVARLEVKRQHSGHYPALDLVGSFNNENTDGTLYGGGSEVEEMKIGVQLSVPLFEGGIVSSRVRQSRHQLSAARQDLSRQERSITRRTRSAYLGVNSAISRVKALQQSVVSNKLALEAKQEGFLSGLYASLNVLDAERDLSLVSLDHAQARYDYILNSLKLKQAVGTLNVKDLEELDRWFGR